MSLRDWEANRWIVAHDTSAEEIAELFAVVDRDLGDAAVPRLSADWQLGITYNAALQLATAALAAAGYRPGRERAHERAIQSLRLLGAYSSLLNYLAGSRLRLMEAVTALEKGEHV